MEKNVYFVLKNSCVQTAKRLFVGFPADRTRGIVRVLQRIVKATGLAEHQVSTRDDDHALARVNTYQAEHVFGEAVEVESLHLAAAGRVLLGGVLTAEGVLGRLLQFVDADLFRVDFIFHDLSVEDVLFLTGRTFGLGGLLHSGDGHFWLRRYLLYRHFSAVFLDCKLLQDFRQFTNLFRLSFEHQVFMLNRLIRVSQYLGSLLKLNLTLVVLLLILVTGAFLLLEPLCQSLQLIGLVLQLLLQIAHFFFRTLQRLVDIPLLTLDYSHVLLQPFDHGLILP